MRPGARMKAAEEVLTDILERHRPASSALADWGRAHRFAGSGDRAAIGTLVFDALRRRQSISARMGADSPRALVLGAAAGAFSISAEDVVALADGSQYAMETITEEEQEKLCAEVSVDAQPAHVAGDFPQWLSESITRTFGDRAAAEGAALSLRAPVDLRANALKADRDKVLKALSRFNAVATPFSPVGVRVGAPVGGKRAPHVEADTGHGKGWFEVQDEGSQLAVLMSGASPREQVLDLCAGAGGKTLAMAGQMRNTGQIYAYDSSRLQLRPIFERLKRAGARNVQVMDAGDEEALSALGARFDLVFVDAPCTGSGTWRRRPDAKWRLSAENLAQRLEEQQAVLNLGSKMVKPGGRLFYVTCSILPDENTDQATWFCETNPEFSMQPFGEIWRRQVGTEPPRSADGRDDGLLLTPAQHGTDGFYIAAFQRSVEE